MHTNNNNNAISTTKKTHYRRILLVDGELDLLITIKNGLEQHGFIVDTFSNPLEALSSFKPEQYDLVLLGVRMSQMNGFELCKEMQKKIVANKFDVKFCFITNFDPYREVLRKEYPELNDKCFINSPIAIDKLAEILNEELEK